MLLRVGRQSCGTPAPEHACSLKTANKLISSQEVSMNVYKVVKPAADDNSLRAIFCTEYHITVSACRLPRLLNPGNSTFCQERHVSRRPLMLPHCSCGGMMPAKADTNGKSAERMPAGFFVDVGPQVAQAQKANSKLSPF